MNRFATILSASALSAIAFGAEGFVAMPAMAADSKIESTIAKLLPSQFDVIRMDSLKSDDPVHERLGSIMPTSPEARQVQASVIANKTLAEKLKAENVELTNIVGAEQAEDGSVTFYVR